MEDTPCLYDMVNRIQYELMDSLFEQDTDTIKIDDEGNIRLTYETTGEF